MTSSFPSGGGSSSTADPLAFLRPSLSGRGGPPPPSRRPVNSGGLTQPSGSHRYGSTFDSTPSFRRLPGNSVPGSSRRDQPMGSLATDFHVPPPTSKMILSHSYGFNTERPSFHQSSHREHDQFARGRPQLPEPSSSSSSFYRKPPSPRGREVRGTSLDSVMGGDFARRPPPSFPSNARDHDVGRSGGFRSFRDFPESRGRSRSPLRRSFKEDLMPLIPLPSRDALVRSFTSERRFRSRSPRRSPTPPPFRESPDRVYGAPRLERDRNGDPMSRFFDSPPRRPLSPAPPLRAPPPRAIGRFDSNPPRYRRPSLDSVVGTRDRFRSPERSVLSREFRPSDSWLMSSPRRETRFPSPSPRASSRENRSRSKSRRRSPTRDRSFKDKKSEPVRVTSRSHRHASKPPPKGPPTATTPRKERKSPPRRPRFADPGGKSKTPSSQNASSHPKSRKESRSSSKSNNASNAEQTRELSNDRDEKSRVSALKRLGPKLGVTERLGPKTAKKDDPKSKGGKDRAESAKNHDGPDKRSKEDDFEVKVSCTPCGTTFPSSKQFVTHLHSNNHKETSKGLKNRLQVLLTTMRQTQRERQKKLEKELASTGQNVDPNGKKWPTVFCKTCKIFLSQKKSEHNKCEMHLLISSFLNPRCPPCDAQFTSPMAFERHVCTVPHLKALSEWDSDVVLPSLAVIEKQFADISDKPDVKEPIVVTLDEVTVVDLDKSPDTSNHAQESTIVVEEAKSKLDPDTVMGSDHVKPVEMYFCDLCHKFLPRPDNGNAQNLIESHCKSESHQKKFLEEQPKEETVLSNNSSAVSQSQPIETGYSYADDDNVLDFEADSVDGDN